MKSVVQSDQKKNEDISHKSHQVHGQDQDKEEDLSLQVTGQPQQNELYHPCLGFIFLAHEFLMTKLLRCWKNKSWKLRIGRVAFRPYGEPTRPNQKFC